MIARTVDLSRDFAAALDPVILAKAAGLNPYPWQQRVLRSTAKRQLLNCARQAGKSTVTAYLPLHLALYTPGSLSLILGPGERQAKLLLDKVYKAYQALGQPAEMTTENQLSLALANGSEIHALPGKQGTVRGFSDVDLIVIDEASQVPESLYHAVRPMLAASDGRLVALSTPFGKRGWWFEAWTQGGEAWERTMITAEQSPHISAEFLAEEKAALPAQIYRQEYECAFVDTLAQIFDYELIQRAMDDEVLPLLGGQGVERWTDETVTPLGVG